MATTKAIIRNKRLNDEGMTAIYIRYTHDQMSILFAVGQMVKPEHWNKSGFVMRNLRGYTNINSLIEKKRRLVDDVRIELQLNGIEPSTENVKNTFQLKYDKPRLVEVKVSQRILDHWDKFVGYLTSVSKIGTGTIRQYRAAKSRLQKFETSIKTQLTFDYINSEFYDNYLFHLYSDRVTPNTAGNQFKFLKAFMNWSLHKAKLTTNIAYQQFQKPRNPTQIFTLSQEQLDKLFLADLSFSPRFDQVRDMFCLCCVTGLRHSDVVRLTRANIKDDHFVITTKKTNDTAIIPINNYSRQLITKYRNGFPRISNQKMNDYLKQLGAMLEFDDEQEVTQYKSGRKITSHVPFFSLWTTHMGRRTFITQSLQRGMLPSTVMKISTHKDHKSFALYINTTTARLKKEVSDAWNTLSMTLLPPPRIPEEELAETAAAASPATPHERPKTDLGESG